MNAFKKSKRHGAGDSSHSDGSSSGDGSVTASHHDGSRNNNSDDDEDDECTTQPCEFAKALESKNVEQTRQLLDNGKADANACLYNGQTPLYLASFIGFTDGIEILLAHSADPNLQNDGDGNTPLYASAVNDQYGTGDIDQQQSLDTYEGFTAGIRMLLDHGADPDRCTRDGETPLYGAAVHGDAFCMKVLLERGADPNKQVGVDARTALYGAAVSGQRHVLKPLLQNGADPNRRTRLGETPVFAAASNGHYSCVKYLIYQGGADWNKANYDGFTPLCIAVKQTDGTYVRDLILSHYDHRGQSDNTNKDGDGEGNKKKNKNKKNSKKASSGRRSHWLSSEKEALGVRQNNHEECIKVLIERTSDINPFKRAVELANEELVDVILNKEQKEKDRMDLKFLTDPTFVLFKPSNRSFILYLLSREDLPWKAKQKILERGLEQVEDQQEILSYLHAALKYLSAKSIEHNTIFLLMMDFYFYIWWIVSFSAIVSDRLWDDPDQTEAGRPVWMAMMILVTIYFTLREILELAKSGYLYVRDYWNWVNISTIILVLLSASKYLSGYSLVGVTDEDVAFQKIVMSAGAFICLSIVGYLKGTFLAFSNFVGGVGQIMVDLLPFATITLIVLLAFSFMYYIQDFGNEGFETFGSAFYTIFTQFVSGLEGTSGPLDLIFGILSVIILLNVVIAIVSSSWENAVDTSLILLCRHRLDLLRQVDAFTPSRGFRRKFNYIPEDYDENYRRFIQIWVLSFLRPEHKGEEWWHLDLTEEERRAWEMKMALWAFFSKPLHGALIVLPWFLGLFTFGLLWPRHVRERLFGIVPQDKELPGDVEPEKKALESVVAEEETGTSNRAFLQIRKHTQAMADDIGELRRDVRTTSGSAGRQLLTLENRIGRIEEQMREVKNEISEIKETNREILRLLTIQNTALSAGTTISDDAIEIIRK